ncbi:DnaJ-like protein subfamily B member 1 [Microtus ochrogaster]|uniref:DnaJ homolog subfamily B member 9 n=1 Tax=Microtus ochrogaster TaxID=79684 RepID=A0A8J6GKQ3_MICOH|nr:DnaJ-like protein subfamily B member 1 [Microtus ochrogaster]
MGKDYYQTLGLAHGLSDDEIKRAYHRQALRYHPDKNKEPGAEEKFMEIARPTMCSATCASARFSTAAERKA